MAAWGWADGSLGDVRPYTITGGRTRATHALQLTTCLITRPAAPAPSIRARRRKRCCCAAARPVRRRARRPLPPACSGGEGADR
ncbi:DUF742 domain-containing protein [Streptomyces zhihengii]